MTQIRRQPVKDILRIPLLPEGIESAKRRPSLAQKIFGRRLGMGEQIYGLSRFMNSEHSRNIAHFLNGVLSQLREADNISLFLTSRTNREIVEHHVTIVKTNDGFKAHFDNLELPLEDSALAKSIRINDGGLGMLVDEKSQTITTFSLRTHDFALGKIKIKETFEDPKQTVIIPLRSSDSERVLGCLVVSGSDLRLNKRWYKISALAFIATASRMLYSLIDSKLDNLTRLMLRDTFMEALRSKADHYLRKKESPGEEDVSSLNFSIISSDIDNFKLYNDEYGHQMGDKKLRDVATILRGFSRTREGGYDLVARMGGEEFSSLISTNVTSALNAASRLRKKVKDKADVTCSFGVVDADTIYYLWKNDMIQLYELKKAIPDFDKLHPTEQFTQLLVFVADKSSYHAKKTGRNRVCYATKVQPGEQIFATHESGEQSS